MTNALAEPYLLQDHDIVLHESESAYVLRFKDLPNDAKPREKLLQAGPHTLSSAELVAVVLGVGTQKEDVLAMAQRITKEYGEKAMAHELRPQNLVETLDIPLGKACQLVASFELGRRYFTKPAGRPVYIRQSKQAYEYLRDMGNLRKEQLRGLYLNSRYQVIHEEVISLGSLTANIVHPREVFQPAIEHGAIAIIIAHNHPSGRLEPTSADTQVTHQLVQAGQLLGIDLIDHLIITRDRYVSLMTTLPSRD
jgi:DNA repair protein RadC